MSRARAIELRVALFDDLSGILNAMRSFALAELQRVARSEVSQHLADDTLVAAMSDVAPALPQAHASGKDVWVLLGAVRGFCGSFNEDVARHFRQRQDAIGAAIVVGERLSALLPGSAGLVPVAGAIGAADATETIERIVAAIDALHGPRHEAGGLVICLRDEDGVAEWRILPVAPPVPGAAGNRPVTYAPLPQVAAGVARHYVFHRLMSALVRSLQVENQMRLQLMDNAMRHIERRREELLRSRNQLRQEEIVEEIELVGQRRPAPDGTT